jgi:hypothetical protein
MVFTVGMTYGRWTRYPWKIVDVTDSNYHNVWAAACTFPELLSLMDRVVPAPHPLVDSGAHLPQFVLDVRGDLIEMCWCNIVATLDGDGHIVNLDHDPFDVRPDGKLMAWT